MRSAVFFPIPGVLARRLASSADTLRDRAAEQLAHKADSDLGPDTSLLNYEWKIRSVSSQKP